MGQTVHRHIMGNCGSIPEWLTIAAEVAVAVVIYLEVEHSTQTNFSDKSTRGNATDARGELYDTYLQLEGDLIQRSQALVGKIDANGELRQKADSQITLVNELGFTATRWFAHTNTFVKLFPQGPVFVWLVLRSYIIRRREDSGRWWARHLLVFTLKCVRLMIRQNRTIFLRPRDGGKPLEITNKDLKDIEKKITRELKDGPSVTRI